MDYTKPWSLKTRLKKGSNISKEVVSQGHGSTWIAFRILPLLSLSFWQHHFPFHFKNFTENTFKINLISPPCNYLLISLIFLPIDRFERSKKKKKEEEKKKWKSSSIRPPLGYPPVIRIELIAQPSNRSRGGPRSTVHAARPAAPHDPAAGAPGTVPPARH